MRNPYKKFQNGILINFEQMHGRMEGWDIKIELKSHDGDILSYAH